MWLNSISGDVIDPVYCLSGITDHKSASNQVLNAIVVLLVPHSQILNLFEHLPGATFWIKMASELYPYHLDGLVTSSEVSGAHGRPMEHHTSESK